MKGRVRRFWMRTQLAMGENERLLKPVSIMALALRALVVAVVALGAGTRFAAPAALAQEVHSIHCWSGCPRGTPESNDLIFRHAYSLSSNDETKLADWVAYIVAASQFSLGTETARDWEVDPWLEEYETLEPDDYRGANATLGTDRGHQAPLASFKNTDYWTETNFLSNITPQSSALNQGAWVQLENQERAWAEQGFTVYVITGPVYSGSDWQLPGADEVHKVPSGYWKSITLVRGDVALEQRHYYMPQSAERSSRPDEWVTSLTAIEALSGLNLYPEVYGFASLLGIPSATRVSVRPAESSERQVWINTNSGVYHCPGGRYYGNTNQGKYTSEREAKQRGFRAANNGNC